LKKVLGILLMLILVFSLVSCTADDDNEETPSETPPEGIEGVFGTLDIYRPPTQNINTYVHYDEWEDYMKDIYGIDIRIHNISPMYQYDITVATYYTNAIKEDKVKGLIEIRQWEIQNLIELMKQGLILPLDDYLADNSVYQGLPGAMRKAFVMPDGQTWAIATNSPFGLYSRKLRKDWVDALDLDLPSSLTELYDLSRAFAYEDPNGNDINDEHGMDYDSRRGARPFMDIFLANGCYLSNNGNSSFSYDYSTDSYEDAVLKPGMRDSLEFIKALHDDGLLHANNSWDFAKSDLSGNFMSLSLVTDYRVIEIEDWYEVYTLSENSVSVMGIRPYKMFAMTSNTENPTATINSFVDIFLSDTNGMARGNYGIEGQSYTFEDKTLKCLYGEDGSDMSRFIAENISLTHFNLNLLIEDGITLIDPQWFDISIEGAIRETKLYNKFYDEGSLFFDSDFMYDGGKTGIETRFSESFSEFMLNIDSVSIDDFLADYIKDARTAGFDDILDSYNTTAGKQASYRYD